MNVFEMSELGKFIRKKRKEKGLRLEDLADEQISTATISNVERGVPHVNKDKIVYLMEKIGLNIHDVPELLVRDSENMESMQLKFTAIESMLQLGKAEKAFQILTNFPSKTHSYHQATIHSLRGKYYLNQKEWKKAERELSESIRLAGQDSFAKTINLTANCYNQLALCRFLQNDLKQALIYVERGIEVFEDINGDHDQMEYELLINQVTYLEKIGRVDEALIRLNELWERINHIQETRIILQMYLLRADLFRRVRLNQDAIMYARQGITLAVGSGRYNEMFHLWMILGNIYLDMEQLDDAETCFEFVKELEEKVNQKRDVIKAYCSLGYLYLLQDRLVEAESITRQAIDLSPESEDEQNQEHALTLMGLIMKKKEDWENAIIYFEQAIKIAEKNKSLHSCLKIYLEVADCYRYTNREENFIRSIKKIYRVQKEMNREEAMPRLVWD